MCYKFPYFYNEQLLSEINGKIGGANYFIFKLGNIAYFYSREDSFMSAFTQLLKRKYIFYSKVSDEEMLNVINTLGNTSEDLSVARMSEYNQQRTSFANLFKGITEAIKGEHDHKKKMRLYQQAIKNINKMTALNKQMTSLLRSRH